MATRPRSGRGRKVRKKKPHTPTHAVKPGSRQERLAAALLTAPTIRAAGRIAGYPESTVRAGDWYRRVRDKAIPVLLANLAKAGLTIPVATKKHFEKLHALETKFFQHDGRVIETREVEAHGIQLQALEKYYDILGVTGRPPLEEPDGGGRMIPEIHIHVSGPGQRPKGTDGKADGRFRVVVGG